MLIYELYTRAKRRVKMNESSSTTQAIAQGEDERSSSTTQAIAQGEDERSSSTTQAIAKGEDERKFIDYPSNSEG